MGESWERLRSDPIVRELSTVIKWGLYRLDADKLDVLSDLFGDGQSGPADRSTIRQELLALLMVDDPGKSPDHPDLNSTTKFNLTLFRALPGMRDEKLDGAREAAGKIYRPDSPVSADGIRRRPSQRKPSGGAEWHLIVRLHEQIVEKTRNAGRSLPPGTTMPQSPVFEERQGPSPAEERHRYGDSIDEAWALLALCRSRASDRAANLEQLRVLTDGLAESTNLNEVRALVEFAAYESNRGLEKYRLEQGVRLLEAALGNRDGGSEVHSLRLLLMKEQAHLAVYGGLLDSDRRKTLRQIVDLAEESLLLPDLDEMTQLGMRVAIAEALKELCFVTHDARQQKDQYGRARQECETVVSALEGESSVEALRLVALAKRHAAITYELEEDKERDPERREECLREWNRLCMEGAELAAEIEDDHIRAYCLINLGSVQSRLSRFSTMDPQREGILATGKEYLDEALPLAEALNDERGRAWVYVHLCENTELRAELETRKSITRIGLVRDLEHYAIQALNHLKPLDDPLGLTVAHLQLGKALCMTHEESEADAATMIRLERAIDLLEQAVEMTEKIGYYQEYPAAARWLARSLKHKWTIEGARSEIIVDGVNALITGICECFAGQDATDELVSLYEKLAEQLDDELRKRR